MLRVFTSSSGLNFSQLQSIYQENPNDCFYEDTLRFLEEPDSAYAVWIVNDTYVSALRWQCFRDGYLIAGVETHPSERRNGYATRLIEAVLSDFQHEYLGKVYSHIHKDNNASIRLHVACGFTAVDDCARLLDGSVSRQYHTFMTNI